MGRNKCKNKFSDAERSRMYRQRKKLKKQRQQVTLQELNETPLNSTISHEASIGDVEPNALRTRLRLWAISHNISTLALDNLLRTLNACGINSVPKNHRTLLETPIDIKYTELAGGLFWYNGLKNCLEQIFSTLNRDIAISLNFNVDGLPIFNSSKATFWPILSSIHGMCGTNQLMRRFLLLLLNQISFILPEFAHIRPMIIAIWCSEELSKPNNLNEYFGKFVNELNHLIANPVQINGYKVTVKIRCFICDTPARAMIKGTIS